MITITVDDRIIQRKLQLLADRISDLSPVMADLSEVLLEEVRENMDKERGPSGPWLPLSPKTILRRQQQNKWPGKKLQQSGMLKNTIIPGHSARRAYLTAGTKYAAIHQFGGPAGRGRKVTIPARPYLYLSKKGWAEIYDTLARHLKNAT